MRMENLIGEEIDPGIFMVAESLAEFASAISLGPPNR